MLQKRAVSQFQVEQKKKKTKQSIWSTLFLILPISFNGATISLLPYQFHLVGVILATVLFILSSVVCVYAGFLIVSSLSSSDGHCEHCEGSNVPRAGATNSGRVQVLQA